MPADGGGSGFLPSDGGGSGFLPSDGGGGLTIYQPLNGPTCITTGYHTESRIVGRSEQVVGEYIVVEEEDTGAYFKMNDDGTLTQERPPGPNPKILFGMFLCACCCLLVGWLLMPDRTPVSAPLLVTGHGWEWHVDIEKYTFLERGTWCSNTPSGIWDVQTSRRYRYTRHIPIGTYYKRVCNDHMRANGQSCSTSRRSIGHGKYKLVRTCHTRYSKVRVCHNVQHTRYRDEPVYDNWCNYNCCPDWRTSDTKAATGSDMQPHAPALPPMSNCVGSPHFGCTRVGSTTKKYTVSLKDPHSKKTRSCPEPFSNWTALHLGREYMGLTYGKDGDVDCDALDTHADLPPPDVFV